MCVCPPEPQILNGIFPYEIPDLGRKLFFGFCVRGLRGEKMKKRQGGEKEEGWRVDGKQKMRKKRRWKRKEKQAGNGKNARVGQ